MNEWNSATPEQKATAKTELRTLGLDDYQIKGLVKEFERGRKVSPIILELMVKLPRNSHSGFRASVHTARNVLSATVKLGLVSTERSHLELEGKSRGKK